MRSKCVSRVVDGDAGRCAKCIPMHVSAKRDSFYSFFFMLYCCVNSSDMSLPL